MKPSKKKSFLTLLACIIIIATSACAAHISRTELLYRIQSGTAPLIVDVRTSWEFENGHVPGAIHVPFWSVLCWGDGALLSEGKPVVVYCEYGPRAYIARADFWLSGVPAVYLDGHMAAWRNEGFPIETHPDD
jgi:rhodanese-related sulfurtransferase